MKKATYIILAVTCITLGMIAVAWAQISASPTQPKPPSATIAAPTAPVVQSVTTQTTTIATKPSVPAVASPTLPGVAAPQTSATKPVNAAPQPSGIAAQPAQAAVPAPAPAAAAVPAPNTVPEVAPVQGDKFTEQFKDALSFPLTEAKMIAFAEATLKVQRINNKWDVQIAGSDTEKMAIEYSNFAVEEITTTMKSLPNLTLAEYNEMTRLTATNPEFSRVYQAYKQLAADGVFKKTVAPTAPAAAKTISAPAAPTKPVSAPVSPSTTSAPLGSPANPYSQQ